MEPDNRGSADSTRIGRRKYLTLGALAAVGLAGCSSNEGTSSSTGTAASSPAPGAPTSVTRTFYTTLYGDDDIGAANELYHPESPSPPLEAEDFESFGGLEEIDTDIQSVTTVSQGDGRATVHADVEYTIPSTTTNATDYMYLRRSGDDWRINTWLPEALRRQFARDTVERFYDTLYNQNDIEAANEMYHPDSTSAPLEASNFEPYGGLENIETDVKSMEIVAIGDGEAEVHAEVAYTTPNGTDTATDHVFLRLQQRSWKIDRWVPEAVRDQSTSDGG